MVPLRAMPNLSGARPPRGHPRRPLIIASTYARGCTMNEEPTASRIPLSFAEEGLWFLDQLAPGSAAYNESIGLRLRGPLDLPALAASLAELVRRHEALRTTYRTCEGAPESIIASALQPAVHRVDLSGVSRGEEEELRALAAEAAVPFDLVRGPLLRITLVRLASDDHRLHLSIHHSIYDAASREILLRELGRLYAAFSSGCPSPLPPPLAQARDSARWQRERQESEEVAAQLAFWRDRLAGLPEISLPADRPSPSEPSGRGARLAAAFPVRGLASLGELGR